MSNMALLLGKAAKPKALLRHASPDSKRAQSSRHSMDCVLRAGRVFSLTYRTQLIMPTAQRNGGLAPTLHVGMGQGEQRSGDSGRMEESNNEIALSGRQPYSG